MTPQGLQPKQSNGNIFSITINNNNDNDSNNNNIGIDADKSIIDENHLHVRKDDDDEINKATKKNIRFFYRYFSFDLKFQF